MDQIPASSGRVFNVADGIARILLIVLAALFPLFVIPLPYVAIPQGKVLFLSVMFVLTVLVWGFARLTEGVVHIPRSSLVYVSLLLPVAYVISTIVAGWSGAALVGTGIEQDTLFAVALMSALFLLTAFAFYGNFAGTKLLIQGFIIGLVALFALSSAYIFAPEWLSFGGALAGDTANLFGSWHDLGILAGLSLFLSLAIMFSGFFTAWKRVVPLALFLLSAFLLLVIHFADIFWGVAIIAALAALAVIRASVSAEGRSFTGALKRASVWITLAALMGLLGAFGTKVWDKLPAPIQITQTEVRPSWQGTFDIAKQSLQAPLELVFGAGPNSFIREWGLHKPASVNATPFWDSDFNAGVGIIPTSIFTSGAIGLLAWAALLLVLLGLFFRFFRESRPLNLTRSMFGVTLLAVAYLVAYHMIYTPGSALTAGTFLCLGLLAVFSAGDASPRPFVLSTMRVFDGIRLFLFVIIVAALIAAAGFLGREVVSNIFVNQSAYVFRGTGDANAASALLARAFLVSPNNDRAHRAAAELGIVQLGKLLQETDPENAEQTAALQAKLQETIQHGLAAVSIDDANYQNWLLLAQIYGSLAGVNIEGAYEQAKAAYEKAYEAHPTNPVPKLRLAQLAAAKGDLASARASLKEAIALKQDFAAAQYLLSQVEASDNKLDEAVQAAAAAAQLVPEDPLGWFNLGYILYAHKSYNDAAAALQEALRLSPDYSNALFYFGLSLNEIDMKDDAARVFDRLAELNPEETWLTQVAANIRAGKAPMEGIEQSNNQ